MQVRVRWHGSVTSWYDATCHWSALNIHHLHQHNCLTSYNYFLNINTNIHLTKLRRVKQYFVKQWAIFCKIHKQIRIHYKHFLKWKKISLKHSGVGSYLEALIWNECNCVTGFWFGCSILKLRSFSFEIVYFCTQCGSWAEWENNQNRKYWLDTSPWRSGCTAGLMYGQSDISQIQS